MLKLAIIFSVHSTQLSEDVKTTTRSLEYGKREKIEGGVCVCGKGLKIKVSVIDRKMKVEGKNLKTTLKLVQL